jgi:transmembrane sensor
MMIPTTNGAKRGANGKDPASDAVAEAQAWLVRLRSGNATPDDLQAYRRWRAERPEHANVAHALGDLWKTLDTAGTEIDAEIPMARAWNGRASSPAVRPGRRAFVGFAVAAAASWLALRPPLQLWPSIGEFAADYRTGTGEQRRVVLSDRIVIEMNTQTRIDLTSTSTGGTRQRGIDLLAGEAEIVAGMPAAGRAELLQPVVVVAGRGRMRADVARFNVRRTENEVCVTCLSGSLDVEHPRQRLSLKAAQQLVYSDHDVRMIPGIDPDSATAWRRGELVFNRVPLAQVVDEINRYRPGKVILHGTPLGDSMVQAQFDLTHLDAAIDMIGRLYDAQVTRLPGGIVVLG